MITVQSALIKGLIFFAGLVIILGVFLCIKLWQMDDTSSTIGMVTENNVHGINQSDFGSTISAEIRFMVNEKFYAFRGPEGQPQKQGSIVPVRYKNNNPEIAWLDTFSGFWLHGLIWCILPGIFWTAISLSVIEVKASA
ncbi:MAG: hypothetical protein MUC81_02935 [Bacteroidia bacterium]|nr:hypothetical protein [Bacteroidia bacterium]